MSAAYLNTNNPACCIEKRGGLLVRRLLLLSGGVRLAVAVLKARSKVEAGDTPLLHAVSLEIEAYESWQGPDEY